MRIRKVQWTNHEILGDLYLDFVNPNTNQAYSTIVLVGENGTGKTTILETLNTFLSIGTFKPFSILEYEIDGKIYQAHPSTIANALNTFFSLWDVEKEIDHNISCDRNNNYKNLIANKKDPRVYGSILSRPRANYKSNRIVSTKTNVLDNDRYDNDTNDDFTFLKQLIIDVQSQDDAKYSEINTERSSNGLPPMSIPDFYSFSKIYRFKKAFDSFFENILKYKNVSDIKGEKVVLFTKNGKDISIDNLSTGEKQIVFRGIHLLKNINNLNGSTVMIDEPELSLHPKWQKKILQYYKSLFTDDKGVQIAQLFFATHSEGVLSEALQDSDNTKVIILNYDDGKIISGGIKPDVLPDAKLAELYYQAFDVATIEYHNALYGYIEAAGCKANFNNHQPSVGYIQLNRDGTTVKKQISLSEKIRHIIHHPENPYNQYTEEELKESIENMRDYIIIAHI